MATGRRGRRIPAAERVAAVLRRRIVDGAYTAGTYMPSERALAEELGTSRRTISGALEALAKEGLIVQSRGRGTRALPVMQRLGGGKAGVVHSFGEAAETVRVLEGIQGRLSRLGVAHEPVRVERSEDGALVVASEGVLQGCAIEAAAEEYGALIFVGSNGAEETLLALEERGVPLVVANLEEECDVSATRVDHRGVICSATRILAALGHERIGLMTGAADRLFYGKAQAGYVEGMERSGLSVDERLVSVVRGSDPLDAYFSARRLMELSDPPTGIVAARDALACGACRAVEERGGVVGVDVSVIGFDDVTWPEGRAMLTTFREPCRALGALAADMLVERIVEGRRPPERRVVEAPLVVRRSAGPPKGAGGDSSQGEDVLLSVI